MRNDAMLRIMMLRLCGNAVLFATGKQHEKTCFVRWTKQEFLNCKISEMRNDAMLRIMMLRLCRNAVLFATGKQHEKT